MKIYQGNKKLRHDVSEDKLVINLTTGVRVVTVDGEALPSVLIEPKSKRDTYSVYDWGQGCIRDRGMNLSLSIIKHFMGYLKDGEVIPNELVFRFFKEAISKLENEWEFTEEQLKEYLARIYKEIDERDGTSE